MTGDEMHVSVGLLTHLGVFLLGVVTWLPFTLWEGRQIKHRGEPVAQHPSKRAEPRSFSRPQIVASLVFIISLLVMGMGFQQMSFQNKASSQAACYQKWGRDVVESLQARSKSTTRLANAQRKRDNSVDNVLLVALSATQADPPLPDSKQREEFVKALTRFGQAKRNLVHVAARNEQIKRQNTYPQLNCNK